MSSTVAASLPLDELDAEDLARARWYGFFSRWFLAPPDQRSLDLFVASRGRTDVQSADPGSDLEQAWEDFAASASATSLAAMRTAYDDTFISVGEAPVSLHACVYLTGFSNERPLADIRQWLAGQGIRSTRGGLLTEDHFGLLCEAMAWLIMGRPERERGESGGREATDALQQELFERFIAPACQEFCQRLGDAPGAGVYRDVGRLFAAFTAVERQAFEIER